MTAKSNKPSATPAGQDTTVIGPGAPAARDIRAAITASALDAALGAIGDRWSLSVIRSAFLGARQFDQFLQHLDVPKQTLSTRLKELTSIGVLSPRPYQTNPVRHAYRLSPTGLALYPNALASWRWERRWASGPGTMPLPRTLHHAVCGGTFEPDCVCAACRTAVRIDDLDVQFVAAPGAAPPPHRSRRWSHRPEAAATVATSLAFGLSVDRWALLIIAAIMLDCRRFDELQDALGVGSSVLSNRLALLCQCGLLARSDDPCDGRRVIYALTPPSQDLVPCLLTLSDWGRDVLRDGSDTIAIRHRPCGKALVPLMACSHCAADLAPRAVTFTW